MKITTAFKPIGVNESKLDGHGPKKDKGDAQDAADARQVELRRVRALHIAPVR